MLKRKHRLTLGEEGIVRYVTATGDPHVALDVGKDPVFFNNPGFPPTHSEMALPLKNEGPRLSVRSMYKAQKQEPSHTKIYKCSVYWQIR